MDLTAEIGDVLYRVDIDSGIDISVSLDFGGAQPNLYDVPAAGARAYGVGSSIPSQNIGDTRAGGNCNFSELNLIPHCNGTHTECIGHLTDERLHVLELLNDTFIPCVLASVSPVAASDTAETALDALSPENLVVTRQDIENHLRRTPQEFRGCIVVRTFPNHLSKRFQQYGKGGAAFFSRASIKALLDHNVRHLITDLPSIDPLDDGGKMVSHRLFWGIEEGRHEVTDRSDINRTITELVYIPDFVADGVYILSLQIAPFRGDAAPSRPILYPLEII